MPPKNKLKKTAFVQDKSYYLEKLGYKELTFDCISSMSVLISENKLTVITFTGKKKSYDKARRFKTVFDSELFIDSQIAVQYKIEQLVKEKKQQQKEQAALNRESLKEGDVFNTHWGYDNTYVNFYQVIKKVSPARVIIRELHVDKSEEKSSSFVSYIKPRLNDFYGEEKRVSVDRHGNLNSVDDYGHKAYKTRDINSWTYTSWGN